MNGLERFIHPQEYEKKLQEEDQALREKMISE